MTVSKTVALIEAIHRIADISPQAAETVASILGRAIHLVLLSGKGDELHVWERAIIAAVSEHASEHAAVNWLRLKPISRDRT